MLIIRELDSWQDFEDAAKQEIAGEIYYDVPRHTIFRGHTNADWHLETSLERMIGENMLFEHYFRLIKKIQTKIETFTNQTWELPSYEDFQKNIDSTHNLDNQTYTYMTYLRHFGFPSPLLDWTKSPFIAAYFAFRNVSKSKVDKVAIYMYTVLHDSYGIYLSNYSYIFPIEKSPRNNKRHELQQGIYTICLKEENDNIYISNHERSGININDEQRDPRVTKFILPASERMNALSALNAYNINSYSLFGTEESLLESLFLERYIFALFNKIHIENRAREYPGIDTYNIDVNDINNIW